MQDFVSIAVSEENVKRLLLLVYFFIPIEVRGDLKIYFQCRPSDWLDISDQIYFREFVNHFMKGFA